MRKATVQISNLTEVYSGDRFRLLANTPAKQFVVEPVREESLIDPEERKLFSNSEAAYKWIIAMSETPRVAQR